MTRISPVVLGGIATAAGGALMLGIGAVLAQPALRHLTRRLARAHAELHRHRRLAARYEQRLDHAETEVRELTDAVAELREGISDVWDRAFEAGRTTDEWTLISAERERRRLERGGGRS
jgi:chromosome segregation ATPase